MSFITPEELLAAREEYLAYRPPHSEEYIAQHMDQWLEQSRRILMFDVCTAPRDKTISHSAIKFTQLLPELDEVSARALIDRMNAVGLDAKMCSLRERADSYVSVVVSLTKKSSPSETK